ncbi:MAG: 2-alkenal reductase [Chloroflexi bacterium CG07_land_8_20_14_0_80_51_10]|nr:MAG: 2-alkenal reductase [Chloroflexi bacterium CG07_land_8_20_14_0_80_51_10]
MRFKASLRKAQFWRKHALILVMLLLMVGLSAGCISGSQVAEVPNVVAATETDGVPTLYDENVVISLYEQTAPAVVEVNIVAEREDNPWGIDPPPQTGRGSGFLINTDGHILTNYHVIGSAAKVRITLHDERILDATVLGTDREDDLALLKVDASEVSGIVPLALGDSDAVKPGQMAIAMGAPFGLEGSITVGVISGIGRSLTGISQRTITDMLQTDAAINLGNSGGPLLNSRGEVVGINTAIQASFSQPTGIGYAVPINTAKSVLPSMMEGGEVHRPWLGISGTAITPELAERLALPVESGVYIISVMPDSPAEEAGLRGSGADNLGQPTFGGDIIAAVDGQPVTEVEDLIKYFNSKKPGDAVSLSVYRQGKPVEIEATLGEWPEEMPSVEIEDLPLPREFDFDEFRRWWQERQGEQNR